jgi:ABC-type glutathione transport system ATPase component
MSSVIEVRDLFFSYEGRTGSDSDATPWTLADLNFELGESETLGVVGESGSGKSTLVRILCGLLLHGKGSAIFKGREISEWLEDDAAGFRRQNQIVFQSPASSMDPRMRIRASLSEPVKAIERRSPTDEEITGWLRRVGLTPEVLTRFPHQLSGGQLQRIGIARALSLQPTVLYADEPTSALDVSVQAQVLNLLMDLREQLGLTLVMVSHDLAVITRMCERLIVLKDGRIVEAGRTADIMESPREAYTADLIDAAEAVSLAGGITF